MTYPETQSRDSLEKKKFRESLDGDISVSVDLINESIQFKEDMDTFRLMIAYQSKILEQLEKLNTYMEIITEEDLL